MSNGVDQPETVVPEGYQFPTGKENATVLASNVDEYYFDTMGIALRDGRRFTVSDRRQRHPEVAIVERSASRNTIFRTRIRSASASG